MVEKQAPKNRFAGFMKHPEVRIEQGMPNVESAADLGAEKLLKATFADEHVHRVQLGHELERRREQLERVLAIETTEAEAVRLRAVIAAGDAVGTDEGDDEPRVDDRASHFPAQAQAHPLAVIEHRAGEAVFVSDADVREHDRPILGRVLGSERPQPAVFLVQPDAVLGRPVEAHAAAPQVDHAPAHLLILNMLCEDEQDGCVGALQARGELHALPLERAVADGEHFVDQQDFRLQVRGDGERQPHVHAAGVALHRGVDELLDLGEVDDLVELARDLVPASSRGSRR